MRRVRFSAAMSLDGYIAGPNGEYDWIVMDPDIDFGALMASFDTLLMGRKSYEAARAQGGGGGMPGMESYVFSRTLRQKDCRGVTVSDDPAGTVAALEAKPGKDIWLFGGARSSRASSSSAWSTPSKSPSSRCSWAAGFRSSRRRPS